MAKFMPDVRGWQSLPQQPGGQSRLTRVGLANLLANLVLVLYGMLGEALFRLLEQ